MSLDLHLKDLFILGDFNINYKSRTTPDAKKLAAWQGKLGLVQYIKGNTRTSKNSASLINLIFSNADHCNTAGVINLNISDHQPVFVIKKKLRDCRKKVVFTGRTYRNYTCDLLSDCLTNVEKLKFREEDDPIKCWDLMETFLFKFLDKNCPKKVFRTRECTPAWITHDLITLTKDRDRAWEQAATTGSEEDWAVARYLRNSANNTIKAAKANYVKNELQNNKSDPKRFWLNIKNVLPDSKAGEINIINEVSKNVLPKSQQAEVINNFFANIGAKLGSKFVGPTTVENVEFPGEAFEVRPITHPELLDMIKHISMYKSSGIDGVSSRVMKDFLTLASREVTLLYKNIIKTGVFPDKRKIATVTPIRASNPTDLRPMSLLPIPGKLLEKYITKEITGFLDKENYFTDKQFGFRKNKSTTGALTNFLDDIIGQLNDGKLSVVAYLDFQKAFDTIHHDILIGKLRNAGIGPNLLKLLNNYLYGRSQKTKLHGTTSSLQPMYHRGPL